jgi:hypothetical protein
MSGLCRLCKSPRGDLSAFLCAPCRDAIGEKKHAELVELEMRNRSGRDLPTATEYLGAWDAARRAVGR